MDTRYLKEDQAISKEIVAEFGEGWLPPLPTVEIEKPAAWPGDMVVFNNYRTPTEFQSIGKVVHVATDWRNADEYQHTYIVRPEGKNYRVKVREVELLNVS